MTTAPYEPDDADQVLADFGVDVVVADGPIVLGLIDSAVQFQAVHGIPVSSGSHVVSVKRGALGDLPLETEIDVDGICYSYRGPVEGAVGIFDRFAVVPADI